MRFPANRRFHEILTFRERVSSSFQANPDHAVDLISDALPFGQLWYDGPNAANNTIGYASHYSRSNDAVIRVYDEAGNVIQMHEHTGDFREP